VPERNNVMPGGVPAALLGAAMLFVVASDTHAGDEGYVQLTFSGVLSHAPCRLDAESAHQQVNFGHIPAKNFYDYTITSRQTIIIRLLNCAFKRSQRVNIRFYGPEDKDQPGLLAVSGEARGVAILLTNGQGTPLNINRDKVSAALQPGNNTIRLYAALKGAPDAVKNKTIRMGDFHASASFILQYP